MMVDLNLLEIYITEVNELGMYYTLFNPEYLGLLPGRKDAVQGASKKADKNLYKIKSSITSPAFDMTGLPSNRPSFRKAVYLSQRKQIENRPDFKTNSGFSKIEPSCTFKIKSKLRVCLN